MKKIIFLFAILLAAAGAKVEAQTAFRLQSTFDVVGNGNTNISFDASTNTFTISGYNSNTYQILGFQKGKLLKYKTLHYNVSEKNGKVQLLFLEGNNIKRTIEITETGAKTLDVSTLDYKSTIDEIRITGARSESEYSQSYTFKLDPASVYLEGDAVSERMTITTTINSSSTYATPFQWVKDPGESQTNMTGTPTNGFGSSTASGNVLFGYSTSNSTSNGCINLTGYDRAVVTLNEASSGILRFLNESSHNSAIEPQPKSGTTWEADIPFYYCTSMKIGTAAMTVNSIDFIMEHDAASTTAFNIAPSASSAINYDREFTVGQASTVCLPFSLTSAEIADMGNFYYLNNVTSAGELQFNKASNPSAYTPYLFVPKKEKPFASLTGKAIESPSGKSLQTSKQSGTWIFKGTLAKVADVASSNNSNTVYGWVSSDGSFKKAGSGVSINAFRAYIIGPASATARLNVVFSDDETTGIEPLNREPLTVNQTYNLQGQRVSEGHKGLVIKNGKKMIVK